MSSTLAAFVSISFTCRDSESLFIRSSVSCCFFRFSSSSMFFVFISNVSTRDAFSLFSFSAASSALFFSSTSRRSDAISLSFF